MTRLARSCDTVIAWCVFSIVFAAPFSKSIAEIAIVLSISAWTCKKIVLRDFRLPATALTLPLVVYALATLLSLFGSAYLALSVKAFFSKMLKFVVLYFAIVDSMDKERIKDLFVIVLISASVIIIDAIFQYYVIGIDILHQYPSFKSRYLSDGDGFFRGFPTASFPFPNDFAAWILLILFPIGCAALFDLKRTRVRYLTWLVSFGLFYFLFLAKVRAAWVAFAISILTIAFTRKKTWLILLLALMLIVPFVLQMEMSRYIFGISSLGDRMVMWRTGWEIFKQHPVIGNGINTFFESYRQMRTDKDRGIRGSYAHNCYLQMACDLGLFGLLAFLSAMGAFFFSVYRNLRTIKDPLFNSALLGLSVGILAFLVHSFFDTNLYSLNLATLFWTSLGVAQAIVRTSGCKGGACA